MLQSLLRLQAYCTVLRSRPEIDPLPNYRRALRDFERRNGAGTVGDSDDFAKHISDLLAGDDAGDMCAAVRRRESSQEALLAEYAT